MSVNPVRLFRASGRKEVPKVLGGTKTISEIFNNAEYNSRSVFAPPPGVTIINSFMETRQSEGRGAVCDFRRSRARSQCLREHKRIDRKRYVEKIE